MNARQTRTARPVQEKLMELLFDREAFDLLLAGQVEELLQRPTLDAEDAVWLRGINPTGIGRFRRGIQEKHLRHAKEALPLSMAALIAMHGADAVLEDLWASCPLPAGASSGVLRRYAEVATDYAFKTTLPVPVWFRDTARYERMILEVKTGAEYVKADLRAVEVVNTHQKIRHHSSLLLEKFEYDVTSLLPCMTNLKGALIAPSATYIAGRRVGAQADLRKLGKIAFEILLLIGPGMLAGEVADRAARQFEHVTASSVISFLTHALNVGLVVTVVEG